MNNRQKISAFFATGFGSGYWPWGPGTAGALVGTLMWMGCGCVVTEWTLFWITLTAIIIATAVGSWTTDQLEPVWGEDPSRVVIDEMIGVWIPLLASPIGSWKYALISFVLFRFFDILKPLGIRSLDRRHGGFWVMADDILAGIYSLAIILILRWAGI